MLKSEDQDPSPNTMIVQNKTDNFLFENKLAPLKVKDEGQSKKNFIHFI